MNLKGAKKWLSVFLAGLLVFTVMAPMSLALSAEAGSDVNIEFSATKTSLHPGEETEISIILTGYESDQEIADILGLQVDVLLDTNLVEFVQGSISTVATGNAGDIIGSNYNAGNHKVIFTYADMGGSFFPRSNKTLFSFKIKANADIASVQTAILSVSQLAVSDATGNRKVAVDNTLSISISPASTTEIGIAWAASKATVAPGEETEITVAIQNYDVNSDVANILGLQVDVLLDTELFEFVSGSAITRAVGNTGDIIGTNYNTNNNKIIFTYADMGGLFFPRSNVNLFTFKVKAKENIVTEKTAVFSVSQLAISDANGNRKVAVGNTLSVSIVPPQAATLSSVAIANPPAKTSYIEGQSFDKTGMVVRAYYSDSSYSVLNSAEYAVTPSILTLETNEITVSYQSKTATVPVTVAEKTVSSISLAAAPTKTTYIVGEAFSSTGGKITVYYNNGTNEQVNMSDDMCSGYDISSSGNKTVTVTFLNQTTSFNITVIPAGSAPQINMSAVRASAGSAVSVTISLRNNPGIIAMYLKLNYDTTRLKLTGVTNGSIFNAGALVIGDNFNTVPFSMNFSDDLSAENITSNGTLATLNFEILDNAPLGNAFVSVSYNPAEVYNFDIVPVTFGITNGNVEVISTHTVTFKDWNGATLKTQVVEHGTAAEAPPYPSREGYDFKGWDVAFSNVIDDMTITAQYQIKTYTVTFKGYNSTTLAALKVDHGGTVTPPSVPNVDGFFFIGWSNKEFTNITSDKTITANYVTYENAPKIIVESQTGYLGKTVEVNVSLEKNPGVVSMYLDLNYDTSKLKLIDVTNGNVLVNSAHGNNMSVSPYALKWDGSQLSSNITKNGVIVTLCFEILENAVLGDTDITVTCDSADIFNVSKEEVLFLSVSGTVNIQSRLSGDVNGDDEINAQDVTFLRRFLAGWENITILEGNSDVNGDGEVNAQDVTALRRYLAGWESVELI